MNDTEDRPLLIILTVASLSQKKTICFLDQYFPHKMQAMTIGYNSKAAVDRGLSEEEFNSSGHSPANHWSLSNPP